MSMNRRALAATLFLAASSLTWIYAADITAGWTAMLMPQAAGQPYGDAAPGDLDTRFSGAGVVATPTATGSAADDQHSLVIQHKILVGGESDMGEPACRFQW
jgi:hypothetical protein